MVGLSSFKYDEDLAGDLIIMLNYVGSTKFFPQRIPIFYRYICHIVDFKFT